MGLGFRVPKIRGPFEGPTTKDYSTWGGSMLGLRSLLEILYTQTLNRKLGMES